MGKGRATLRSYYYPIAALIEVTKKLWEPKRYAKNHLCQEILSYRQLNARSSAAIIQ